MDACVTTDGGEAIFNHDGTFNVGGGAQVCLSPAQKHQLNTHALKELDSCCSVVVFRDESAQWLRQHVVQPEGGQPALLHFALYPCCHCPVIACTALQE